MLSRRERAVEFESAARCLSALLYTFQNTPRGRLQHIAELVEGGISRIPIARDRHGARHRHEFSLSTVEEHEESAKLGGAERG